MAVCTGKRVLTKGSAPPCQTEDEVSVTIRGQAVMITTGRLQNFTTGFDPCPDGSFSSVYQDVGGAVVSVKGRVVENFIEADFVTRDL